MWLSNKSLSITYTRYLENVMRLSGFKMTVEKIMIIGLKYSSQTFHEWFHKYAMNPCNKSKYMRWKYLESIFIRTLAELHRHPKFSYSTWGKTFYPKKKSTKWMGQFFDFFRKRFSHVCSEKKRTLVDSSQCGPVQ